MDTFYVPFGKTAVCMVSCIFNAQLGSVWRWDFPIRRLHGHWQPYITAAKAKHWKDIYRRL